MGVSFDSAGSDQYYNVTPSTYPVSAWPVTFVVKHRVTAQPAGQGCFISLVDNSGNNTFHDITALQSGGSTYLIRAETRDTSSYTIQESTLTPNNDYHTAVYEIRGDTDRELYFDNVSAGTNTNSTTFNANLDVISIGVEDRSIIWKYLDNSDIAYVALYGIGLTSNERQALTDGIHPKAIRSGNLVGLWEFYSPDSTIVDQTLKRNNMVKNGSPVKTSHANVELLENYI